jgi:hypothetical protein
MRTVRPASWPPSCCSRMLAYGRHLALAGAVPDDEPTAVGDNGNDTTCSQSRIAARGQLANPESHWTIVMGRQPQTR